MAGRQASGAGGRRGGQPRAVASKGRGAAAAKGRGSSARSTRQFASRGAARTGRIVAPGEERRKPEKTLGGEQVEGRQAVRELLIAGKRKVSEV